jgi:8-oxo-dGTP pyrophosphatase MutT (NUDIX family)
MTQKNIQTHFESPWVTLKSRPFDSTQDPYYYLEIPDYVCILAILEQKEILLVEQYRAAIDAKTMELPAGLVEKDESPEKSAIRECREETGYEPQNLQLLYKGKLDPGRLNNTQYIYYSDDLVYNPLPKPEETLTCHKVQLNKVDQLINQGKLNAITYVLAWNLAKTKYALL